MAEKTSEMFRYGWDDEEEQQPKRAPHAAGNTTARGYGWRHQQIRRIHLARDPICAICRNRVAVVSDHIVPMSQGGDPWSLKNRQGVCQPCNEQKTAQDHLRGRERRAILENEKILPASPG